MKCNCCGTDITGGRFYIKIKGDDTRHCLCQLCMIDLEEYHNWVKPFILTEIKYLGKGRK